MGQHVVKYVNLTLLILYPISWFSPLMSAGLLPLFGMSEITIISGILTLWQDDPFLSLIVILFAVLLPMAKTLCKVAIDFGLAPKSWTHALAALSRFAMADVFLIALYITAAKGIGVGRVETEWGLYLFTLCALLSILVSVMASSALSRTSPSGRS
jgi:uncharacterized paraquat-inducible protein A